MPITVRPRGRRIVAFAAQVPVENDTYLDMSGLSIGRVEPGQVVTPSFTVSHHRGLFQAFASLDTFTGVVEDATGNVVTLLDTAKVKLRYGQYTLVRLVSVSPLPDTLAGQRITVGVGPYPLFAAALPGQPYGLGAKTMLVASTVVPAKSGGSSVVPPATTGGGSSSSLTRDLVIGGVLAGTVTAYVAVRHIRDRQAG